MVEEFLECETFPQGSSAKAFIPCFVNDLRPDFIIHTWEVTIRCFCFQSTIEVIENFVDFLFDLSELEDRHVFVLDRAEVLVERSDGRFVSCTGVR